LGKSTNEYSELLKLIKFVMSTFCL